MKIAVCIKQVPSRDWHPRLDDTNTWIRELDATYEMNEPDAYALEEALRLKEKHGGEVVVCSAGPARVAQVLREALARGGDRAIHVEADASVRVKRELEGGWFQWITMPLPALLTIQSGINQLRYATLKGIMGAKKKEIRKVEPAGGVSARQQIAGLYVPEKAKKTQLIGGSPAEAAKELVRRLREEARVI
jgi:electron transfer flavoprotein alpha/beta subunit